jgi:acetyl esterase
MTRPFVRPDVQAFLQALKEQPRPAMSDETIAMMRQIPPETLAEMMTMTELPVADVATIRDVEMPGPAGPISLRLFDQRTERRPGPVVVFFHGGGFVVGSIDTHASLAAEIARGLDLPVISVEYRLAPEHKWPAAPDDAEAAARWIAANPGAFEREFTSLIVCGDSAGGNLSAITCLALRDDPAALPLLAQIAIYPKTDSTQGYPSEQQFGSGFGLDASDMRYFGVAYRSDPWDWRGSPILLDQDGMPPTLVATAGLDPLRDDGRAYAAKLIAGGVQTTYREFPGTVHGFCTYRKAIPSARQDLATILVIAKAMIAEASAT